MTKWTITFGTVSRPQVVQYHDSVFIMLFFELQLMIILEPTVQGEGQLQYH